MAFCTGCGANVPDEVKFCTVCGMQIDRSAQPIVEAAYRQQEDELVMPPAWAAPVPEPELTLIPEPAFIPEPPPEPAIITSPALVPAPPEPPSPSEPPPTQQFYAPPPPPPTPTPPPPAPPTPQPQQTVYNPPTIQPTFAQDGAPPYGSPYAAVGTGWFFGTMFLFSIPVIGWIACIIMALATKNRNKKSFACANLIYMIIGLAFAVAMYFLFRWIWSAIIDYARANGSDILSGLIPGFDNTDDFWGILFGINIQ